MVGLVEHGDLDRAEVAVALADEVLEPAGAGDDDVDAAAQAVDLRVLADAAEDGLGAQAGGLRPAAASASSIWLASSRVGARISARGRSARRGGRSAARRATSGSRKA